MVNKVILIGNVGVDPEVRTLESGAKVARVRLATTERLFDRQANETKEHTEWHTITLWRGLADVVDRYVNKGSQIYIEGRLRTREWTDKDNNKRYTTEILADDMKLLGRRGDNQSAGAPAGGYAQPQGQPSYQQPAQSSYQQQPVAQAPVTPAADDPDDLPFLFSIRFDRISVGPVFPVRRIFFRLDMGNGWDPIFRESGVCPAVIRQYLGEGDCWTWAGR